MRYGCVRFRFADRICGFVNLLIIFFWLGVSEVVCFLT